MQGPRPTRSDEAAQMLPSVTGWPPRSASIFTSEPLGRRHAVGVSKSSELSCVRSHTNPTRACPTAPSVRDGVALALPMVRYHFLRHRLPHLPCLWADYRSGSKKLRWGDSKRTTSRQPCWTSILGRFSQCSAMPRNCDQLSRPRFGEEALGCSLRWGGMPLYGTIDSKERLFAGSGEQRDGSVRRAAGLRCIGVAKLRCNRGVRLRCSGDVLGDILQILTEPPQHIRAYVCMQDDFPIRRHAS